MSKKLLGLGALLDGVLILLTQYSGWPNELNYFWGALVVIWGFLILKQK